MRSAWIRGFAAPLLILALGAGRSSLDTVPLFAQYASEDPSLRSYSVPLHAKVAIHKLITFHFGMNGMVYYRKPDRMAVNIDSVPEKYRKTFAELGTPRTWPMTYDLQVTAVDETPNGKVYHLCGTPRTANDIDHLVAEVRGPDDPVKATWFLRGGGTITSTTEFTTAGRYQVPKVQHADIDVGGVKLHADLEYGDYEVNGQISDAVF
ncbi:MAG: hypothetical protein JO349_09100 [Candidatus Eremiobacteraeota bacterium]|nr:hypothetical protein [Candidatus Eremiobacteraeota bacterium]MBV8583030.1 hypothetical protein [Candidatus Eremiobacteraeota bacterium]